MRAAVSAIALAAAALLAPVAISQLTPAEERGRAIYYGDDGSALDRATVRIASAGNAVLPAASLPCASCHGQRGEGRTERGVKPANLDRSMLSKPYGQVIQGGAIRPPYDEAAFVNALANGHDPSGRELAPAMPRYTMDRGAMSDLWAFLAKVGSIEDPGVTDASIRLGAVLTLSGENAEEGRQMKRILESIFDATNKGGGIHGRSLQLVTRDAALPPAPSENVFSWIVVASPANPAAYAVTGAPVLAPWGHETSLWGEGVFGLTATQADQVSALTQYAAENLSTPKVTSCAMKGAVRLIEKRCTDILASKPSQALLTLPAFQSLDAQQRASLPANAWVALPVDFAQINPATQKTFSVLHGRISPATMLAQAHAYTSAAMTIEILKRTGRKLDRERFHDQLTRLTQFLGGMTPPLSYSAKKNIGSTGALIVRYDKSRDALGTSGMWIDR